MRSFLNLAVVGCICLLASCATTDTTAVSAGAIAENETPACCQAQSDVPACCQSQTSGVAQIESTETPACCQSISKANAVKQIETTDETSTVPACCSSSKSKSTDQKPATCPFSGG